MALRDNEAIMGLRVRGGGAGMSHWAAWPCAPLALGGGLSTYYAGIARHVDQPEIQHFGLDGRVACMLLVRSLCTLMSRTPEEASGERCTLAGVYIATFQVLRVGLFTFKGARVTTEA